MEKFKYSVKYVSDELHTEFQLQLCSVPEIWMPALKCVSTL